MKQQRLILAASILMVVAIAPADSAQPIHLDAETAAEIRPALEASPRGQRFIEERIVPYQKEFGWHAVWSHEFVFPTFREDMTPIIQLVRYQYADDYDYNKAIGDLRADIEAEAVEILEGLEEGELLITAGTRRLIDGMRVKVAGEEQPAS